MNAIVHLLKALPIVALLAVLLTKAQPASAMACFTDLGNCYQDAANVSSFWMRWAAGLDCELTFISCARQDIIGY